MIAKKILHVSALILIAAMLFSFCGCSAARKARPNSRADKIVATAGNVEIPYENLYYIAMTRIKELTADDEHALDSAEAQAELREFVLENLLTATQALISLGYDYDLRVDEGEIAESVQADMETILSVTFEDDRDAYIESLNAEYLTDRYIRTYIGVEDYLPAALIEEMLVQGDIDDSDEAAETLINGEDFVRTVHVFISKSNGKSDEVNRANAIALQAKIAAEDTDAARYDVMRDAIGGKYNNDYGDTQGNGYYFARGETEDAYEEVAFSLAEYAVSEVLETSDGYYIIMRMPKDPTYIEENFQTLKEKSYYVSLNQMLDERLDNMTLEMTDYGNDRLDDLMDLPAIDADGGESLYVVLAVVGGVLVAGCVFFAVSAFTKRKGTKKKKTRK